MLERIYKVINGPSNSEFQRDMLKAFQKEYTRTHKILYEHAALDCFVIKDIAIDVKTTYSNDKDLQIPIKVYARGNDHVIKQYVIPEIKRKTGWTLEEEVKSV